MSVDHSKLVLVLCKDTKVCWCADMVVADDAHPTFHFKPGSAVQYLGVICMLDFKGLDYK